MKKEINGKTYELVEVKGEHSICGLCAFKEPPHGCKLGANECCNVENASKYWKLSEQKTNKSK